MGKKIAIAGCGASGMVAAISAVRNGADPGSVTIYEASDRPGRKILATGNGRCNLGNEFLDRSCFYTSDAEGVRLIDEIISSFSVSDLKDFFDSLDLMTVSKNGYLYPRSMQSSSVLNALLTELKCMGVEIRYLSPVRNIMISSDGLIGFNAGDSKEKADKLIISCGLGSGGFDIRDIGLKQLSDGVFNYKKPFPALCGLSVSEDISSVMGVRAPGKVSLYSGESLLGTDEGEIQFTKDHISGIPVFQISRFASICISEGKPVRLSLDLMSDISVSELEEIFDDKIRKHPHRKIYEIFNGAINEKLLKYIYLKAGISGRDDVLSISKDKRDLFIGFCKRLSFDVTGTEDKDKAQTMCGGIPALCIGEFCELIDQPNVFVTGEIIDIDAKCGGYNLYLAWATGMAAGRGAAK